MTDPETVADVLAEMTKRYGSRYWQDRIERAMEREDETVDQATPWTDDQCIEFACVAFRHAKKNLPKGVTLDDIRLGAIRVGHMTMQNVTRKNEQSVMRALAEFVAESSYPDDPRLEVAYAIARHLNLGWPSADSAMAASAVPVAEVVDWPDDLTAKGVCFLANVKDLPEGTKLYAHAPPAVPSAINSRLYHAVNLMMAVVCSEGEIRNRTKETEEVMAALAEIDGGTYAPAVPVESLGRDAVTFDSVCATIRVYGEECIRLGRESDSPPASVPDVIESIAAGWDDCYYDDDMRRWSIGDRIRADAKRLLATTPEEST